jgi:hypothetical protein
LSYDTVCCRHFVEQGCLIPLPQVVAVPYTAQHIAGTLKLSREVLLVTMCCYHGVRCFTTLLSITNRFRPFSTRRAELCAGVACSEFYKTLWSASWTGGQGRSHHSSYRELPPRPCALSVTNLEIVLPVLRTGIGQNNYPGTS